ncbi:MAG: hypothetical protein HY360_25400 [Verrucomicrobia bacterium]|nr:hypothetical protein [Verrucomicrobiota bacterium]
MPELDFSYFNPWLDTARRNGLWRFDSYTVALIGDKWASEANLEAARKQGGASAKLAAQPPKEIAHRIDVWFWGQLFKYIALPPRATGNPHAPCPAPAFIVE